MSGPLVLLHGFTGSPASWDEVVAHLPSSLSIVRVALLGHDPSIPVEAASCFEEEVDRIDAVLDTYGVRGAHLCGYSLGARLALGLLVRHPERFERATLIGGQPGLADLRERCDRIEADERWCRMLLEQGIEPFVAAWEQMPLFATQGRASAAVLEVQRSIRLAHDPVGLAASLRVAGLGRMPWYEPALEHIPIPVCLMVGEEDEKFRTIAVHMTASMRHPTLRIVAGAGHNVPLEQPRAVAAALMEGSIR